MIKLRQNFYLIEKPEDLPTLEGNDLYLDVETNSFNQRRPGDDPYNGDRICGVAVTSDDDPNCYYIPVRHSNGPNIEIPVFQLWLRDTFSRFKRWINHNIKFDAHFCWVDGAEFEGDMICTLTLAKTIFSDRWRGHGLKTLCVDWCDLPMGEEKRISLILKELKSKNYADVSPEIMGEYACEDVWGNRILWKHIQTKRPDDMEELWNTEIKLTPVLFDMERGGMKSDKLKLKLAKRDCLINLIQLQEELANELDLEFVDSNKCMYDIVINQLALPVIKWGKKTKSGARNPSFNKEVIDEYLMLPQVAHDPKAKKVLTLIQKYRIDHQFLAMFVEPYLNLADENGYLHPSFNQAVRTGRLSCSHPNAQQLNKRAKELIIPEEGCAFLSRDASQIEYRIIADYSQDENLIGAYRDDPDTDIHEWVGKLIKTERSAGKTTNFGLAYGLKKSNLINRLATDENIMAEMSQKVNQMIEAGEIEETSMKEVYVQLCQQRGEEVYYSYHQRFPNLRKIARYAENRCKEVGYVFNKYKRRRHLTGYECRKAFNAVIQGGAADFIKRRMIACSPRYNQWMRDLNIRLVLQVHDELLFEGPTEVIYDKEVQDKINTLLEDQEGINWKVPFTWDGSESDVSWAEAS